jgi:hypothetical protein
MKKLIFTFLFVLTILLLIPDKTSAFTYPISDLGYCQNQKECHLYCEISANQPACWAYRVYKTAVLGDTTDEALTQLGFTFPIPELGNCANYQQCHDYCLSSQNSVQCRAYSQNQKSLLTSRLLEKASIELGCTTLDECKLFCSQDENKSLCESFRRRWKLSTSTRKTILQRAQSELGCQTLSECKKMCAEDENLEYCRAFAKRMGLKTQMTLKDRLGCTTSEECRQICSENPDHCPGFPRLNSSDSQGLPSRTDPRSSAPATDSTLRVRPLPSPTPFERSINTVTQDSTNTEGLR